MAIEAGIDAGQGVLATQTITADSGTRKLHDNNLFYDMEEAPVNEVESYLKEKLLPRTINPAEFWKSNSYPWLVLALIYLHYSAIPATCVPAEQVFSSGSDLVTKRRNRLATDSIGMIMCLKNWGIIADEGEEDDDLVIVPD